MCMRSLLPKYRGAAPIQWAIANGETITGVTTMRIDAGLDTGDMLLKWETAIGPEENALELGGRLAQAGADLLVETLAGIASGVISPEPQDNSQATLAPDPQKRRRRHRLELAGAEDRESGARLSAVAGSVQLLSRPDPAYLEGARCRMRRESRVPGRLIPMKKRVLMASGDGSAVELIEVQIEGRKRMPAEAFAERAASR